jgi:hypothetical protein
MIFEPVSVLNSQYEIHTDSCRKEIHGSLVKNKNKINENINNNYNRKHCQ